LSDGVTLPLPPYREDRDDNWAERQRGDGKAKGRIKEEDGDALSSCEVEVGDNTHGEKQSSLEQNSRQRGRK
jgi:hypothetical protein